MSGYIKKQFEITRANLFKTIGESDPEILTVQPQGFRNTIHWHIGHILTVAEQFLFGKEQQLSDAYAKLFGYGSKPADWEGEVPSVEDLVEGIKSQLLRIKEIPDSRFVEKLPQPVLGQETFGELAALAAYHEAFHYGQIHAMKKVIEVQ